MRKFRCCITGILIVIMCVAGIMRPVCAGAVTLDRQTEERTISETETEHPEESEAERKTATETVKEMAAVTETETTAETVAVTMAAAGTTTAAESETGTELEPESELVSVTEGISETEEAKDGVVYSVSTKFFGKGRMKMTDGQGKEYFLTSDSPGGRLTFAEDESLAYEVTPGESCRIDRADIYKDGALIHLSGDAQADDKITGEIVVDSDVLFELYFQESSEEIKSEASVPGEYLESGAKAEGETGLQTETKGETETEVQTETKGETEAKTDPEKITEKQEEKNRVPEALKADGKLSFMEGMASEALAERISESISMSGGQIGQVWGMYKIFAGDNVIIDEFMPGFQSNDYSKIIQTGPTLSENTMTGYCIQFGVACPPGGYVTESNLTPAQKLWMGYALAFGWKQTGSAYDEAQYSNDTNRTEYAVTQAVIWACSQNKFGTDVGEAAINKVIQNTLDPAHAEVYYNQLKSQMLGAERIPSFSSRSQENAPTILLKWNGDHARYEAVAEDTNGVLSRYNYECPGITISENGNRAEIYTTGNYPDGVTVSALYTTDGGENAALIWDGASGNQDLAAYRKASTEIHSYIRIATEDVGAIELQKKSSHTGITDGNRGYSLAGAVYGVYDSSNREIGRITTDNKGRGKLEAVPAGNYTVRELTAPKGYAVDMSASGVVVTGGDTETVNVVDHPKLASVTVALTKVDKETGEAASGGNISLEGAEFTVKYYDVQSGTDPAEKGIRPLKMWVLKTDAEGKCYLSDVSKVSGDSFFYEPGGSIVLPLGTVTVQETKAPEGYVLNEEIYVRQVTSADSDTTVAVYNQPTVPEQRIRGAFEFIKNDEDGKAMADIPFRISSKTTGEHCTVYSDKKGRVTTEGLWFGGGTPDESLGGLPYDTYIVEELACIENEDKILIAPFEVKITENNEIKNLGILENNGLPLPELDSAALGRETGDHTLPAEGGVAINESLECRNLIPGVPFSIRVKAVDPETGNVYVIDGKELSHVISFVAEEKNETKNFTFDFSAVGMAGKSVTITAELLRRGQVAAVHNQSLDDADQTVTITKMTIDTVVSDKADGDKILNFGKETTKLIAIDEVSYEGFLPGRTYKAVTEIVETATGNPVMNSDIPVSFETEFTPENRNGTFAVDAAFGVSAYDGSQVTVFQTIYDPNGHVIAEHKALDDADQTVDIRKIKIGTTAADGQDDDKTIVNEENVVIKDVVAYENLTPGKEHKVTGILMDKETNEPLLVDGEQVTGETVFIPEAADGSAEVEFVFDAIGLHGKKLVVFETLLDADGKILAEHKEIEDEGQTVEVWELKIGTTAIDKEDEDKIIVTDENITIKDTVSYENVIPGRKYAVEGILMDTENNTQFVIDGKPVTGRTAFTPEKSTGSVDVEFTFNAAGLEDMNITVFEKLLNANGTVVAVHEDITDKDQTIEVKKIKIGTTAIDKADGDKTMTSEGIVTILDKIAYEHLIPGRSYIAEGVLMDKFSEKELLVSGKPVTGKSEFIPEAADGSVEVAFTFDATGLGNIEVVAFERLLNASGTVVAVHEDFTDKEQTVEFKKPEESPESPKTGDTHPVMPIMALCILSAAISGIFVIQCRKKSYTTKEHDYEGE